MGESVSHFTDLKVWQKAHDLFRDISVTVDGFPRKPAAKVISYQILRSASSIGANIAEGFASQSSKEYLRYLDIAFRTTNETENWLLNIQALGLAPQDRITDHIEKCVEVRRMLIGLRRSIRERLKR